MERGLRANDPILILGYDEHAGTVVAIWLRAPLAGAAPARDALIMAAHEEAILQNTQPSNTRVYVGRDFMILAYCPESRLQACLVRAQLALPAVL